MKTDVNNVNVLNSLGEQILQSDKEPIEKLFSISKCATSNGWPWAKIVFGSRCLIENVWGLAPDEIFPLSDNCIFRVNDITYGWKWKRSNPKPQPGQQNPYPIFPSVNIGRSAWGIDPKDPCTDTVPKSLPKRLSDIKSFSCNLAYQYITLPSISDEYNFAYDIWVTTTPTPTGNLSERREIMVWLNKIGCYPAGNDTGKRFTDPDTNIAYDLYYYPDYHVYSFIMGDIPASPGIHNHKINLKSLLDFLVKNGYVTNDLYLSQICLGNEIYRGTGKIYIYNLALVVNKVPINGMAREMNNVSQSTGTC